jgi:hypothetical protein
MKLCLIKQACSQLTSIQDINDLIYTIYKKHISYDTIIRFIRYDGRFDSKYHDSLRGIVDINTYTKYASILFSCYLHPDDIFAENGTVFNGTIKYDDRIYSFNPGICIDCMYKIEILS